MIFTACVTVGEALAATAAARNTWAKCLGRHLFAVLGERAPVTGMLRENDDQCSNAGGLRCRTKRFELMPANEDYVMLVKSAGRLAKRTCKSAVVQSVDDAIQGTGGNQFTRLLKTKRYWTLSVVLTVRPITLMMLLQMQGWDWGAI